MPARAASSIRERIRVPADSWIALRAGGPGYFDARRTLCSFERGVFAHTSPIYLRSGPEGDATTDDEALEYLLTRVDAARAYVTSMAPTDGSAAAGIPTAKRTTSRTSRGPSTRRVPGSRLGAGHPAGRRDAIAEPEE